MRPVKLFPLILLVGVVFAFDFTPYLTLNESNASVTKEYFTINSTIYTLVNISGKTTFLLQGETLLLNKTDIEGALKSYYTVKYSITPNETNSIKTDFLTYNASRNDGGRWKGKEEFSCKQALFIPLYPCTDNNTCWKTAQAVCAGYAPATGCNDPRIFYQPVMDFALSSLSMDSMMSDIFSMFNTMTVDNSVDYVTRMKAYIPAIRANESKMVNTIFRTPAIGTSCPNCFGICPDLVYDSAALNRSETKISALYAKVAPLSTYKQYAEGIYNNTQLRLLENDKAAKRDYYKSVYAKAKAPSSQIKNRTTQALLLVDNPGVKTKLLRVGEMEGEIDRMINANNFTTLNSSILDYSAALSSLNASLDPLFASYYNASDAASSATVYLFIAEGKTSNPDDMKALGTLREKKLLLDQQFKTGLTMTQYSDITSQYSSLMGEEKAYLAKKGSSGSFYMFASGITYKFVDGVGELVMQVTPLTFSQRSDISSYVPSLGTLLLFLSFSSVVLFFFVVYYGMAERPLNKYVLAAIGVLLVFLIALLCVSVYLSLDKAYGKLEYTDFLNIAKAGRELNVIINADNVDDETLSSMKRCAALVSLQMGEQGVPVNIYEMKGGTCTGNETAQAPLPPAPAAPANGTNSTNSTANSTANASASNSTAVAGSSSAVSITNCLDKKTRPTMLFNYSQISSSSYSGLLTKQAAFSGDKGYYNVCAPALSIKILNGGQ